MGPPLTKDELGPWARSRGLSEADAEQLIAVGELVHTLQAERDRAMTAFDNLNKGTAAAQIALVEEREALKAELALAIDDRNTANKIAARHMNEQERVTKELKTARSETRREVLEEAIEVVRGWIGCCDPTEQAAFDLLTKAKEELEALATPAPEEDQPMEPCPCKGRNGMCQSCGGAGERPSASAEGAKREVCTHGHRDTWCEHCDGPFEHYSWCATKERGNDCKCPARATPPTEETSDKAE